MELNEKQIESIGLYLQGSLKGTHLSDFLKELENSKAMKAELKLQSAILEGIEHKNNLELRSKFKEISKEINEAPKEAKVVKMPLIKIISSIAAISLVCLAAYFLMNTKSDTDSLYASYFEPSELTITRSTDIDADLATLKELYNTQQYDKAVPLFESVVAQNPSSSNLRLAYGNALLKCKKTSLARQQFEYIINAKDPLFIDQGRWYLALTALKEKNVDQAIEILDVLNKDANSDFHSEAQSLLNEIKDLK